ncbi:MAG: hypothetical protein E7Z86_04015 [Methanosphaera stadtmanae]|jgi:hypothetical protein|nr:hypothetical protein [Methanosphaera stadtmanae]
MYELKHLLEVIKYDKASYIHEKGQIIEKEEVCRELNDRIIELRDKIVKQPENNNLAFELEFCENELARHEADIEEFYQENDATQVRIDNTEKLIEYDFKELYKYVDLLGDYYEFNVDESIIEAFHESLDDLENNIKKLSMLKDSKKE